NLRRAPVTRHILLDPTERREAAAERRVEPARRRCRTVARLRPRRAKRLATSGESSYPHAMNTVTTEHHGTAPATTTAPGTGIPGLESGRGTLRPHPALLRYYALSSLVFGPAFLAVLLPRYFRFRTLRYEFDDEGVSMHWGILFRREVSLTYSRIQDIHLTSNVLERWMGLAKIEVQTASGSAKAEVTAEGLREFEAVRGQLYSGKRGA